MDNIYNFSQLENLMKNIDNEDTVIYLCLCWLGLSHQEILKTETDDYNSRMRILHSSGRAIYIKEDRIAELLSERCKGSDETIVRDADSARHLAEQAGIDPAKVYKMAFFKEKLAHKKADQPEDKMIFKSMIGYIGEDEDTLEQEFDEYCNEIL